MARKQKKQKIRTAAPQSQAPPEQPALGKQLRSNSIVSNDPPTTPPHIHKPTVHFDETQGEQGYTSREKGPGKKRGKRGDPPKPVRLRWGPSLTQQMVTMGQALNTVKELKVIKKKTADKAIAKYKAQLKAEKTGILTTIEVKAVVALVKGTATARAEAKAAAKAREDISAAIQNTVDNPVPSPTEEEEFSIDSNPEI